MPQGNTVLTAWEKINIVRSFNDGQMTCTEKSILNVISTHLGDNDFVFVSLATLANECCLSHVSVIYNLNRLIARKYITKIPPSDGYKSNRFVINFDVIEQIISASIAALPVKELNPPSKGALLPQLSSLTPPVKLLNTNRKLKALLKEKEKRRTPSFVHKQNSKSNNPSTPKGTSKSVTQGAVIPMERRERMPLDEIVRQAIPKNKWIIARSLDFPELRPYQLEHEYYQQHPHLDNGEREFDDKPYQYRY